MMKLSLTEAIVELLQSGEGVPCQKSGMRCGVVCVASTVLIEPVPLIDCPPGAMHGGGLSEALTVAR